MSDLTNRERFLRVMEYRPVDRVPNWEAGVWGQTIDRWKAEGLNPYQLSWDWFTGEDSLGYDPREFIPVDFGMMPAFEPEVLEETDRYVVARNSLGVVTRALKEGTAHGTRASMDQYLRFPVEGQEDFRELKKRFEASLTGRYPVGWRELMLPRWKSRQHVLVLGRNCSTLGFYWRAREWMGTENVSYAWYDQVPLMHEMMEFIADFTMEVARPIVEATDIDYVFLNEDMAMKSGPLLSPDTYRTFILPHMRRLVDYLKTHGVRYVLVDSDGNTEPLIPLLLEAGVDGLWPLERASWDTDPAFLRRKYGKGLRLWGAVDKREIAKGPRAIDEHLRAMVPLIEEGGFIPTVDHTVPPDISLEDFRYYLKRKADLLRGCF
ncbi:MAG TPA: uroporphyrinogen decarboxylase family protein [Spirochaetia bacterium]|nr:uroporphyrinogen decarboxylase family protein [Spirochaetia bacterium]